MIAIDAAFVAGLGCVVGAILPIVVGIILLTWTIGELKVMLLGWFNKR